MNKEFDDVKRMILGKENTTLGYVVEGKDYKLTLQEEDIKNGYIESIFSDESIMLKQVISKCSEGFYRIQRTWTNRLEANQFIFATEVKTSFSPNFSLIPCVLYNENKYGNGGEPKGLLKEGKPWVFGYSRTGLPSATISENEAACIGFFVDTATKESLVSSGSLIKNSDGTYTHRIYYPEIELPVAYTNRDKYSEAILDYINLEKGESFSTTAYLTMGKPKYRSYGLIDVYNKAATVLNLKLPKGLSNQEVWDRATHYVKDSLSVDEKGYSLFTMGNSPGAGGKVVQTRSYELGWCGQNALLSTAMIVDYIRNGNQDSLDKGISVIDTWVTQNKYKSGIIGTRFADDLTENKRKYVDSCCMGWGAFQVLQAYQFLKEINMDKQEWLQYATDFCDLMCDRYSSEYGFGKLWDYEGNVVNYDGTIGVFINLGLIKCYEVTKNKKYLDIAEKALKFYDERDLKNFTCTAGALDTNCVDKETCWPMMHSAISLYQITGNEYYKEVAERAGYYMLSWTYLYDVIYESDCDFKTLGYRTKGATAVSAQHHHVDPWGGLIASDFERFFKITGENQWHQWAEMMWRNCTLCIAGEGFVHKGIAYPYGAQGEASFHTNWVFDGDYKSHKGLINMWFVAWPTAFRLYTLMMDENFLEDK